MWYFFTVLSLATCLAGVQIFSPCITAADPLSLKNGAELKTFFPICVSVELFFQIAFTAGACCVTFHLSCNTKCVIGWCLHCCLLTSTGNRVIRCHLATWSSTIGTSQSTSPAPPADLPLWCLSFVLLLESSDKDTSLPWVVCSDVCSSLLTGHHSMFILSLSRFFGHAVATQLMIVFAKEHS